MPINMLELYACNPPPVVQKRALIAHGQYDRGVVLAIQRYLIIGPIWATLPHYIGQIWATLPHLIGPIWATLPHHRPDMGYFTSL